jgi:hypothetical protein
MMRAESTAEGAQDFVDDYVSNNLDRILEEHAIHIIEARNWEENRWLEKQRGIND